MTWTRENIGTATDEQKRQMDWVYATLYFRNEDEVAGYKREKTAAYNELFSRYSWAMDNRPDTAGAPPLPAFAMEIQGDITGWSELVQSKTVRVCETKVYKPQPKPEPGQGKIGVQAFPGSDWFTCLPGDTTSHGVTLVGVSQDGIAGLFQKVASPIQSSSATSGGQILGWWQKKG